MEADWRVEAMSRGRLDMVAMVRLLKGCVGDTLSNCRYSEQKGALKAFCGT